MTRPLNVFFSIDENYIQHFTVAVTSLLENSQGLLFKIFVIHNLKNTAKLNNTSQFLKQKYRVDLNLIGIGHIDFSRFTTNQHYTCATYFRLFLADILPKDIDDGLILDADLVITGSIKELHDINIANHYIYAASEAFVDHNTMRLNKLGLNLNKYFNAGVLLVNLKKWREDNLTQKFLKVADEYMDRLEWYDQDILNVYFANNWGEFDKKYNAVHLQNELPEMPVIIHYASVSKPWYYVDTHPYNSQYWKYLALTPFKGTGSLGFSVKNFLLKNGRLTKRKMRKAGIIK